MSRTIEAEERLQKIKERKKLLKKQQSIFPNSLGVRQRSKIAHQLENNLSGYSYDKLKRNRFSLLK